MSQSKGQKTSRTAYSLMLHLHSKTCDSHPTPDRLKITCSENVGGARSASHLDRNPPFDRSIDRIGPRQGLVEVIIPEHALFRRKKPKSRFDHRPLCMHRSHLSLKHASAMCELYRKTSTAIESSTIFSFVSIEAQGGLFALSDTTSFPTGPIIALLGLGCLLSSKIYQQHGKNNKQERYGVGQGALVASFE